MIFGVMEVINHQLDHGTSSWLCTVKVCESFLLTSVQYLISIKIKLAMIINLHKKVGNTPKQPSYYNGELNYEEFLDK